MLSSGSRADPALSGLIRGVLLQAATAASGQFSVQSGGELVYRFTFDLKTWIERDKERVSAASLRPGEFLEVVCDRDPSPLRYARIVHVMEKPRPVRPPLQAGTIQFRRSLVEFIAPRGDLTFTGIVSSLAGDRLILRTRFDGEKIIFSRKDTRYLEWNAVSRWNRTF